MTMPSEQPAAGGDGGPTGQFLQLGKLEGRLVCSPDLDQLLSCADLNPNPKLKPDPNPNPTLILTVKPNPDAF